VPPEKCGYGESLASNPACQGKPAPLDCAHAALFVNQCLLVVACLAIWSNSAIATRYAPHSNEQAVAASKWIFTGTVLNARSFKSDFVGAVDVQLTVLVGRTLYGTPPKTVVLRGNAVVPPGAGRVFVFFAEPLDSPIKGVHGQTHHGAIRPLSELKEIEQLVAKKQLPK
jgi:hypothetical protein